VPVNLILKVLGPTGGLVSGSQYLHLERVGHDGLLAPGHHRVDAMFAPEVGIDTTPTLAAHEVTLTPDVLEPPCCSWVRIPVVQP
jgi:hypothetical protein